MRHFTEQVVNLLNNLDDLEKVAAHMSSERGSFEAQRAQTKAANQLYVVIEKKAEEIEKTAKWDQVVTLVEKMAELRGKPQIGKEFKRKLAAAVIMDDMLQDQFQEAKNTTKIASLILYGREFMMDLLRGALT